MRISTFRRAATMAAGALLLGSATGVMADDTPQALNDPLPYGAQVTVNNTGHILGNTDAPIRLVEYMSYTCPHCGQFAQQGEGMIRFAYVPTGLVSYEIRHMIRDKVDLAAALLAHCGTPAQFAANHTAIMAAQPQWLALARKANEAQRQRWFNGPLTARNQAIANDLGFYQIMESRGFGRVEVDKCLANAKLAERLELTSDADAERLALPGTPSFLINGQLLDRVASWQALYPVLQQAVANQQAQ